MIRNYFKTALRNLVKNKQFALINISGLAVGMAVTMLIGFWIWDEISFNKNHINHDQVAQIARKEITNGETYINAGSNNFPIPLAAELKTNYANYFKNVSLVSFNEEHIVSVEDKMISMRGMFAESAFKDIFTLKMAAGSADGLNEVNTILLSRSNARALFGNEDAIGKMLRLDNLETLKVTGVYEDMPENSEFAEVSFLVPWNLQVSRNPYVKSNVDNWTISSWRIYVQTKPGIGMDKISKSIADVYLSKLKGTQSDPTYVAKLFLHPMKDWHLRSEWTKGIQSGGRIRTVWMFGIIGAFVLLLACINFINLSTARSAKRAKEVGIRKAVGSLRHQLIKQFMGESFLLVCIAFAISLALVYASMDWFNTLSDKNIILPFTHPLFWTIAFAFIIITSAIAGSYPAFYLSAMRPVEVLKGKIHGGWMALVSRRALVGLQFTVSISLIIGTIVVYYQVQHARSRPIGYDKNGLIQIVMNTPDLNGKGEVLRKDLIESGGAGAGQPRNPAPINPRLGQTQRTPHRRLDRRPRRLRPHLRPKDHERHRSHRSRPSQRNRRLEILPIRPHPHRMRHQPRPNQHRRRRTPIRHRRSRRTNRRRQTHPRRPHGNRRIRKRSRRRTMGRSACRTPRPRITRHRPPPIRIHPARPDPRPPPETENRPSPRGRHRALRDQPGHRANPR